MSRFFIEIATILCENMPTSFKETDGFKKDFKRLAKKYKSLAEDFELFKKIITQNALGFGVHFNVITKENGWTVIKARLFCRYLKGRTLRIIYSYWEKRDEMEVVKSFEFIELYFKGEKENEDRGRIREYLKSKKIPKANKDCDYCNYIKAVDKST